MKDEKGFTLIEVLIALIIVAIGVLGHAKMQAKSMNMAQQGFFAQTANTALLDLAQRMRANSDLAASFVFSNLSDGADITASKDCSSNSCDEDEFATEELAEWFDHLQNNLPSPRFSVEVDSSDVNLYNLMLIWDAAKTGVGSAVCDTTALNSYQCGSMSVWVQ
ncbi:type IV pilus modification protein PilV [Psychromonas sp. B3M02]|uniref:type IV pilus modification protein PilV n=1 Tax=Psychromonas sp. B3M02 TaxID=2267226 RepID=UPI000DEB0BB0|nr:type IV pilus modification protein PilV [Psychromonas sp. B3M02]RBW46833.1 type IV pilus modification protein PilV [Psychromonas sp. B3M02]